MAWGSQASRAFRRHALLAALCCLCAPAGCHWAPEPAPSQSLLKRPSIAPDSVVLERLAVRFEPEELQAHESLWNEIDEQVLPVDLRRRLRENGFRAGVVGGQLPGAIEDLLRTQSREQASADAESDKPSEAAGLPKANVVTFDEPDRLRIRRIPLRDGRRGEVICSKVYDQAPLLEKIDGQLRGKSYRRCQGLLAVFAHPAGDGSVRLEVTPEAHFGEARQQFTGENGVWRLEPGRPRREFAQLAMSLSLAPGEMFVLSSRPDRPGSLGHYFLAEESHGAVSRKVILLRAAQTQFDGLFSDESTESAP